MSQRRYTIDATDQPVGRLASQVAMVLMGKNHPDFEKNVVSNVICEVTNVDRMKVTGKKLEQKKYYRVSQYPGGIKETGMDELMENNPQEVLKKAVYNMLPKNRLRKLRFKTVSAQVIWKRKNKKTRQKT